MLDVKSIEDSSPLAIGSEDNEPDEFRPFPTAEAAESEPPGASSLADLLNFQLKRAFIKVHRDTPSPEAYTFAEASKRPLQIP